ncbi:MAG: thioredoxin [Eubacteriales bacterium]|nr:thioredoxin [Eubacteriales bacterium]
MVKVIKSAEFDQVENSKAAVVDFSATWCGPCHMMAPVLDKLSDDMAGKMDFFNMDVDENPDMASRFGITSIPCLIIFQDGKEVKRSVGFLPEQAIKPVLEEFAK